VAESPDEQTIRAIRENLDYLATISPEGLVRQDILGVELSFHSGVPLFTSVLNLFQKLGKVTLEGIPLPMLTDAASVCSDARSRFQIIAGFSSAGQPNPVALRDQLINEMRDIFSNWFQRLVPIIAYGTDSDQTLTTLRSEALQKLTDINTTAAEMHDRTKTAETEMQLRLNEADATLKSISELAAKGAVSTHAKIFEQQAQRYNVESRWWLGAAAAFGLAAFLYAWFVVDVFTDKAATYTVAQSIQISVAKLAVFALLYFAITWTARTFGACKHNAVVNKHRQNALNTFDAFIEGTKDPDIKDQVLVKVSESIFSPEVTGFIAKESLPRGPADILNIVKSFGSEGHG
jgi:hypothetical protein